MGPRQRVLYLLSFLFVSGCWPSRTTTALAVNIDLALGEWRLHLKSDQIDAIFPFRTIVSQSENHGDELSGSGSGKRLKHLLSWPLRRTCGCHLSIFPNGTFALMGPDNNHQHNNNNANSRLSVHGRWSAPNNPYCATDRSYQSIHLESYPRRQRLLLSKPNDSEGAVLLQRNQLVLHGRLEGQFRRQGLLQRSPQKSAVGSITHGKIVQENLSSNNESSSLSPWYRRPRPVVASFTAQQIASSADQDE